MLAKFPFGGEPSRGSRDASGSGAARIANGGALAAPELRKASRGRSQPLRAIYGAYIYKGAD